jgi:hypothetical protein
VALFVLTLKQKHTMKTKLLFLALASFATANAAPPEAFWKALHHVETSGRLGPIPGDFVNGKSQALGPLQIHRAYWQDSGVPGRYSDCADLAYSRRVVSAYLRRYARAAWERGDAFSLARVHNGGPSGAKKRATLRYAQKVVDSMRGR